MECLCHVNIHLVQIVPQPGHHMNTPRTVDVHGNALKVECVHNGDQCAH